MANLIIKPLLGQGNTVTIQDQAGGAILTSGNSGATIASGVTVPAAGITGALPAGITGGAGLDALSASNLSTGTLATARLPADTLKTFTHLERGWNGIGTGGWNTDYIWSDQANKWATTGTGPTGAQPSFTPSTGITKTFMMVKLNLVGYQTSSGTSNYQHSVGWKMYIHTSTQSRNYTWNSDPSGPGTLINNKSSYGGRDDYHDRTGPSGTDTWSHYPYTAFYPIEGLTSGTPYYVHIVFHNPGGSGTSSPRIVMGWIESLTFFEYS